MMIASCVVAATAGCPGDGGSEGEGDGGGTQGTASDGTADGADETTAGPTGCQRIDVIVATDNSSSLEEERELLRGPVIESLPGALLGVNGGIEDFHLGVIDGCPKPANLHDTGREEACGFSTGTNYMSSTSPDLAAEFACVMDLSDEGYMGMPDMCLDSGDFEDDDEQAALAAAEAVSSEALAGANAGFLRDDALLFVISMTDEDEQLADVASTQEIYDRLVAAKGDVSRVVYLGIAGGSECEGELGDAFDAVEVRSLAELFEMQGQGMFADLCTGDIEAAVITAVELLVDPACQQFEP